MISVALETLEMLSGSAVLAVHAGPGANPTKSVLQ